MEYKIDKRKMCLLQVVKMLVIVVAMFAVLWFPYRFSVVYNSFASTKFYSYWFRLASRLMSYLNSASNPILYNVMSSKFRDAFNALFLGKCVRLSKRTEHTALTPASEREPNERTLQS